MVKSRKTRDRQLLRQTRIKAASGSCVAIFIFSWIILRQKEEGREKKNRDAKALTRCFVTRAHARIGGVSPGFFISAGKSAQETAIILSPLYVARKTRNNAMEFPEDRPVSLDGGLCVSFFFLPPFFFSLFLLFFGRSSFESFHKVRLPHPTLSSSSLDRARWDASGIVSHRHDSREFIVMVSWTFLGRYRAKKETIRRERERERERKGPRTVMSVSTWQRAGD